jgi:hypothetical protein
MKKVLIALVLVAFCVTGMAESKYVAGLTAAGARVNFGAIDGPRILKNVSVETGATAKKVLFYARTGSPVLPTALTTTNATAAQTSVAITNGDVVIYQHANGVCDYLTVASATTANIYFTSAPSAAWASGDVIYELAQIGSMSIGVTNGDGVAILNTSGDALIVTPNDSPLSVFVDSSTNSYLSATCE